MPLYAMQIIFQHSRECDQVLVQKAIMAMMRLCQRLLPYKAADISEPLMRGIQLMSLVDDQVGAQRVWPATWPYIACCSGPCCRSDTCNGFRKQRPGLSY